MPIKIVTLNCWGGRMHDQLLQYLQAENADVYCLQEVNSADRGSSDTFAHEVDDGRPPIRPKLFSEIGEVLKDHAGSFHPFAKGFLHDAAPVDQPVSFGIATFVRKNLQVIAGYTGFVHGTYRSGGKREHPGPRNTHCFRIWRDDVGKPMVIAHMHGLWLPDVGKGDTPQRIDQARKLAQAVRRVRRARDPVVVCGDFNVLPTSETFKILDMSLSLRDLVINRGFTDTRTSLYKKTERYADYMLVSPQIEVDSFDIPATPEASDHRPLVLVAR